MQPVIYNEFLIIRLFLITENIVSIIVITIFTYEALKN